MIGSDPAPHPASAAAALIATVAASLGLLGFFKCFMFSVESLNSLLALFGRDACQILQVTLPIGISFFTFHAISYTVDVYRGKVPAVEIVPRLCVLRRSLPQLVAGPILRYHTVADQFVCRDHTVPHFASGVSLFILGFAKKILLANPMGEVADAAFGAAAPAALDAWFGARGLCLPDLFRLLRLLRHGGRPGPDARLRVPEKLQRTVPRESITDLWRRWHISLSTFLRDYLYIPLGGNRKGPTRTYANLAFVMLLGGLWHGAKWTFVAWGAYPWLPAGHGAAGAASEASTALSRSRCRIAATFVLMLRLLGALPLRESDGRGPLPRRHGRPRPGPGHRAALLAAMLYTPKGLLVAALCAALVFQPVQAFDWSSKSPAWTRNALLLMLFAFSLCVMATQAFNPFLYYQFPMKEGFSLLNVHNVHNVHFRIPLELVSG